MIIVLKFPDHRIIGGSPTRPDQYPHQVGIYLDRNGFTYFCGGTLISSLWVLTTASCVNKYYFYWILYFLKFDIFSVQLFSVVLGTNDLNTESPNQVVSIAFTLVVHPEYNEATLDNDIGLIQLAFSIAFNGIIAMEPSVKISSLKFSRSCTTSRIGQRSTFWVRITCYFARMGNY